MRRYLPIIVLILVAGFGLRLYWKPNTAVKLGPSVRVDFINVGQGDSIFVHTPDGANALIDAGEEDAGVTVVSHLKSLGVKSLDLVVMTHPHSDHIGGMPAVLKAFPIACVIDSGYAHGSKIHERILRTIQAKKIPYKLAKAGTAFTLGDKAKLEVLSPSGAFYRGTESDANNNSVVTRLVFGQVKMLFTGDIEKEAEGGLIASRQDFECQVLKVAHHGSNSSTSLEFLRLARPEYVVISVGRSNEYGHPHRATLRKLAKERTGAEMFRTDKNGTVTVKTDGVRLVAESEQ